MKAGSQGSAFLLVDDAPCFSNTQVGPRMVRYMACSMVINKLISAACAGPLGPNNDVLLRSVGCRRIGGSLRHLTDAILSP